VGVENKMKNKKWTEPEIQTVRNNFIMSIEDLSELLGRSENSVLNMKYKLKNQGFKDDKNYVWDLKTK
jgi:biotin operon repressor